MATFVPVCSVCEKDIFKMLDTDDNPYWLHFASGNCSGPYYPRLNPPLNQVMEFDHVIRVNESGNVQNVPLLNPYFDLNVDTQGNDEFTLETGWTLLSGFTGQYSYNGPVMHPSEFIGGGLETHILETPGYYVSLVVNGYCHFDESQDCDPEVGCNCEPAGWAVAFKPFTGGSDE